MNKILKPLVFLPLLIVISCNSNNDINKKSIQNEEGYNVDLMIEKFEQKQTYPSQPKTQLEVQISINFKMDSILNVEKKKLETYKDEYNNDTSSLFLKMKVEEQLEHVNTIQKITDRSK